MQKNSELIEIAQQEDLQGQTLNQARVLEGSVRNTGIHACGVIITPDDITNFVPVALAKDSSMYCTQFDNAVVESAGLLKMDFLGLKTLTLIKDTVKIVKARHDITLDPENFPLDDTKTYELFQRGETVGIFQYESAGMQKYMKELKPTVFADLIAMNALYRPGPLEYIPSFIDRKHGREEIIYDLDACEEYLKETYGITVYQEQVMLLSQKLADFTKGEADILRKAMGKKQKAVLDKMKPKFIEQASKKGFKTNKLEKIWKDWEAFAAYAFNKSHSTCYAWIAYQTAYLKAHYPAEYMAAVLSNNMNDIKQVTFFMEECKRMKLEVLGPDVNESFAKFSVNTQGAIRFGLAAIKGVGSTAVKTIIEERESNQHYNSIFDLAKRIDLRVANKKAFEGLAYAGAFDSLDEYIHRAQYFNTDEKGLTFLEKALRFGNRYQENEKSTQISLFGENSAVQIPEPEIPPCESWGTLEKLSKEKEVIGMYISGHPLDDFKYQIKHFTKDILLDFTNLEDKIGKEMTFAGIVSTAEHRVSKAGKGWAFFTVEDYQTAHEFRMFGEEYLKFQQYLKPNTFIYVKAFVREGWVNRETGRRSDPKLQFTSFELLHDIIEKYAKKITLEFPLSQIKLDKLDKLENILENNKGETPLYISISEPKEKLKIDFNKTKNKDVMICETLLQELEDQEIQFKIN